MANEAVILEKYGNAGDVQRYTINDNEAIVKNTVMLISGAAIRTAYASCGTGGHVAGIAVADKVINDGSTTLGVVTNCLADLRVTNDAISAGQMVRVSGANLIELADDDTAEEQGQIIGKAMEDTAVGVPETIAVRVLV